jgi:hypothetical protein
VHYWRRVGHQAWKQTIAAADLSSQKRLAFTGAEIVVTTSVLFWALGSLAALDFLGTVGVSLLAFATALCLFFVWHLIMAPAEIARIDAAAHEITQRELDELKRKMTSVLAISAAATGGTQGYPCRVYVNVLNTGDAEAKNARGRLIGIRHPSFAGEPALDIPLAWEQPDNAADVSRKSFYGLARLNVATSGPNPNYLYPAFANGPSAGDEARFPRDDVLIVEVEVTADNMPRTIGRFKLRWYSFVRVPSKDGTSETIYPLGSATAEVEDLPSETLR